MTEPTYRLLVQQDDDADGPIQWGELVSVRTTRVLHTGGWRDSTPESGDDPLDLVTVGERMTGSSQHLYGDGLDDDRVIEAIQRWARIFHGVVVERWQPQGYSQSDWGDALVYLTRAEEATSLAEQETWLNNSVEAAAAWYRGDVYGVTLQTRVTWQRTDQNPFEDGATMTTWEDVDSIWGNYLNGEYTANGVAREHFVGLPAGGEDLPVVEQGVDI